MPTFRVQVGDKVFTLEAEDAQAAQEWGEQTHAEGERLSARHAERGEASPEFDATAGMSLMDKTRANLGAGFDTAWQGAKQILPGLKGPSDADLEESRADKARLAQSTETGAGASWVPSAGSALQFAGEMAPSLAIPAGAATGAGARFLPRALQALVKTPLRAGVTGGAVAGALQPVTSEESRTLNTGLGAAGGAVLPGLFKLPAAVRALRGQLTAAGGAARAPKMLRETLGADADKVAQAAARPNTGTGKAKLIPETLSQKTGNVRAAQLESVTGREAESNASWANFMREQNRARYASVQNATREADMLGARADVREQVSAPMRQAALGAAKQDKWFHVPVGDAARGMLAGDTGTNPAVRSVANYVLSNIDERAGSAITPARLYEIRKVLADKLDGPHLIGDEMSAAVKGASRETRRMMGAIDDALDQASGGKWKPYLETYSRASQPVTASKAAQAARAGFESEVVPELGGVPHVTQTRLGRALDAEKRARFDAGRPSMSPPALAELQDVSAQLARSNEAQSARKLAGTAGGGSQTSTDLALEAGLRGVLSRTTGQAGAIGKIMHVFSARADDAAKQELTRLLQNPQAAAQAIRAAGAKGAPLSEAQQVLLAIASRAGSGALLSQTRSEPAR